MNGHAKKNIREGCTDCPTTQDEIIDFVQRCPTLSLESFPSVFLPQPTFLRFDPGSFALVGGALLVARYCLLVLNDSP